jgi:hypothetical protein
MEGVHLQGGQGCTCSFSNDTVAKGVFVGRVRGGFEIILNLPTIEVTGIHGHALSALCMLV